MRQVPAFTSYLIVGDGRMARHAAHYLKLEALPHATWRRADGPETLATRAKNASHVLVLISDRAIETFLNEHAFLASKTCVHFSGTVTTELARGAHPLMTFSDELYELDDYRRIPFVVERGANTFAELLPGLSNPSFEIDPHDKALYHAMCAMAGNFTVLLWEKAFRTFGDKFGWDKAVLTPYLERIAKNLLDARQGQSVLTGPLARGDHGTIDRHLAALTNDPYSDVYRAFDAAYAAEGGPR